MMVADILRYWYGVEVPRSPRNLRNFLLIVADAFSMPLLRRTFFAPWRGDVVSAQGLALPERFRAFWYNLVAVGVGVVVRLFVLLVASVAIAAVLFGGVITLLVWVVLPFLPVVLFMAGIIILFV